MKRCPFYWNVDMNGTGINLAILGTLKMESTMYATVT